MGCSHTYNVQHLSTSAKQPIAQIIDIFVTYSKIVEKHGGILLVGLLKTRMVEIWSFPEVV